jgi:hypothetical protein
MEVTALERNVEELLEPGERYVAASKVHVPGIESPYPDVFLVIAAIFALLILLPLGLLAPLTLLLVILVFLGYLGVSVVIHLRNRRVGTLAWSGNPGSIAATFPGWPGSGMWLLLLTDRRLTLWYPALVPNRRLVWNLPAFALVRAEAVGRHPLPATAIRLHFRDGSSVRLQVVDGGRFLLQLVNRPPSMDTLGQQNGPFHIVS